MRRHTVAIALVAVLLLARVAAGQKVPTGTLTGRVTDGTLPLPGVTVTLTSPNQQGVRNAYSTENGDYILELLPPGPYSVRFTLDGFEALETTVRISGDLTSTVDAVLPPVTRVTEEITVPGRSDQLSATATNATAYVSKTIQLLPVGRDVAGYVGLTPGTVELRNDFYYFVEIGGAWMSDSLNLIDGATANDNAGGYLLPLYIEDAIEEVTTSLSGVSAEYGRFTGGVVSVLTKSGGNEFHGSLRLNLTSPKWSAPTPLTVERSDKLGKLWEGTFGGYLLKDRLWFFLGGRTISQSESRQTEPPVSVPYERTVRQDRYEGKLTFALSPSHRIIGSYLHSLETHEKDGAGVYDLDSLGHFENPQSATVLNYSGVLSNALFVEAQYSERTKVYEKFGSRYTDIERGTPVIDLLTGIGYNSPWQCAVCPDQADRRNNRDAFAKASLFLSTKRAGSHDVRVGVDLFEDRTKVNDWLTGSGYAADASRVDIVGSGAAAAYYPVFVPGESFLEYYPIFAMSQWSRLKTRSAFVNDAWHLNDHLSFNLGVRYDENDGTDQSGDRVVGSSRWSPRLSVTWDPRGDGATQLNLGYGEYVAAISDVMANMQTTGGWPAWIWFFYEGPPINTEGDQVQTRDALRQVFAWLDSIGGPMANPQLWFMAIGGYQTVIGPGLRPPYTKELTAGVTHRLGRRGLVRLDYVHKSWRDFYSFRTDLSTGTVTDPFGNVSDRTVVESDNTHTRREYRALLLQGDYRFGERVRVGGNYTYSKLYGTDCVTLQNYGCTPINYPEYNDPKWYVPSGYLSGDHRHTLNLYASWDAVDTARLGLTLSVLQRYLSGAPYGASSSYVLVSPYVANPGYAVPPDFTVYPFTARDAYRTDAVSATDLALTFVYRLAGVELYVNPRVTNVLDRRAVITPNTTVYTRYNKSYLNWFDPFTETPKECPQGTVCSPSDGANWQKGPSFGKAVVPTDYQTPRTFLVNLGVRF